VQVIPRVGYVVSPVTANDVHEIFQLRLALETTAVDLAAARANPQMIELLKRPARHERARSGPRAAVDAVAAEEAHRDLHVLIASISGNRRLVTIIGQLLDESQRLLALDPLADEQRDLIGIRAHGEIVRAIEKRDRRGAIDAMIRHLKSGEQRILAALMPEPTTFQPVHVSRSARAAKRAKA
jgi:DNA-binding GntR family transcriptional regulator